MDKAEAQRQLDFLLSQGAKEWREKFPEKFAEDVKRLEANGAKQWEQVNEKTDELEAEISREELKVALEAKGVKFDGRASTETLKKLLDENN